MPPTEPQIRALHSTYCRCTRLDMRFTTHCLWVWERWCFEGYTQADLELVCAYIQRLINKGQRKVESFKFRSLIEDLPRFADDICMARAQARQPSHDPAKADVLRSTGRAENPTTGTARSAAEVMQQHQDMATMLKEWRDKNL